MTDRVTLMIYTYGCSRKDDKSVKCHWQNLDRSKAEY